LEPLARPIGASMVLDLIGFRVNGHLCGGFEGVQKSWACPGLRGIDGSLCSGRWWAPTR